MTTRFAKATFLQRAPAVLLAAVLAGTAAEAAPLRLLTEENSPSSFTRNGKLTGQYVEVAQEIQARVGDLGPIEVLPWARGYLAALNDANVVLFPTTRSEARERLFQWVGPVSTAVTAFYARRGAGLRINDLADARAVSGVLVPRGWYMHDQLLKLDFKNLVPTNTPEQMVAMLVHGRAPLMYAMQTGIAALLEQAAARLADVEPVYVVDKAQGYFAFSLKTPPEVVHQWQAALDKMKQDGSFAVIYERWYPGEKPPGIKPDADTWPSR
jgi:polar amino acid transport system substrate-binding protein